MIGEETSGRFKPVVVAGEPPPLDVKALRQLGHSNLGITSVYVQGIDSGETVHARRRI